ncbi:MAG TPA: DNA methyltransferase [Polyangiaceae bacterium]|nr:DNA methyltransferase [Polyangiaceae bacterium]
MKKRESAPRGPRPKPPGRPRGAAGGRGPGGGPPGAPPLKYLRRDRRRKELEDAAKRAQEPQPEEGPPPERRERRALSHVGGRVEVKGGDPDLREALEAALDVDQDEEAGREHVHGFHSYAARLHPGTARTLVERLSAEGETVLDPFMGSGTVLVEARLLGRRAIGADLNPLSADLAHLKTRGTSEREREELLAAAARVTEHAEERRIAKKGPTKRYDKADLELFDIHMLLELDGLKEAIFLERPGFVREALKLVLSAILVKVSKKPGDTVERTAPRRLASGFAIRLFGMKTEELAERLRQYAELLPKGAPECRVEVEDARRLGFVKPQSVDLVVTSPPYPGVYDYAHHHEARLRWLELDPSAFEAREMGARRHTRQLSRDDAIDRWADDFVAFLRALRRVLAPGGAAVLVLADSVVQKEALYADDVVSRLAPGEGFEVVSVASQRRPHFHEPTRDAFRRRPRQEHLIVVVPTEEKRGR